MEYFFGPLPIWCSAVVRVFKAAPRQKISKWVDLCETINVTYFVSYVMFNVTL